MTVSEKLQLVEEIWGDIATHPDDIKLATAQEEELDRRLESHRKDPGAGVSWEDAKKRLGSKE